MEQIMNLRQAAGLRSPITMSYANGNGQRSERTVNPISVYTGSNGYTYLLAYCSLRKETRTFRVDRIESWTLEAESGSSQSPDQPQPVNVTHAPAPVKTTTAPLPPGGPVDRTLTPASNSVRTRPQPEKSRWFGKTLRWAACIAGFLYLSHELGWFSTSAGSRWSSLPDDFLVKNQTAVYILKKKEAEATVPPVPKLVPYPKPAPRPKPDPAPPKPAPPPLPRPEPAPIVRYSLYQGITIQEEILGERKTYSADGFEPASSLREMWTGINRKLFRGTTAIVSPKLEALYVSADTNRDGALSWSEVTAFQASLYGRYSYQSNGKALKPDEFLEAGGGDCEDWALVTCGLFRFWGYASYVGCLDNPSGTSGHAICLVYQEEKPDGLVFYELQNGMSRSGSALARGFYVPIDYQFVGRLSEASGTGWKLDAVYEPESIYGDYM